MPLTIITPIPPKTKPDKVYSCPWYSIEENRNRHNERAKEWYHRHKDKVLEKRRQRYDCEICGGKYTADHKNEHFRSKKHANAVTRVKNQVSDLLKLLGKPDIE